MTSKTTPALADGTDRARYWLLVHDGIVDEIGWDDGERLLALATEIRLGRSESKEFMFVPRGAAFESPALSLFVDGETPIELLSQYEGAERPGLSHWFG